ncbi:MAG: TetR/AcrR family transcriptional regulator [Microbacteriaceae bacterium]|nr:MAG: TetR/AcrR family transcriptional regulator [Microbacteriaceae bacterium]
MCRVETTQKRYAKTAERRRQIALAALEVVREKGHRGLTTAEVARRAGLKEPAMLYHFPSRDHLLVAALEISEEQGIPPFDVLEEADDALDTLVDVFVSRQTEDWRVRLSVVLAAAAEDPEHPAHNYFRRHYELTIDGLAKLVRLCQEAGVAHAEIDPVTTARQLAGVWDGLQAQWLVTQDFDLVEAIRDAFRKITGQPVVEVKQAIDALIAQV